VLKGYTLIEQSSIRRGLFFCHARERGHSVCSVLNFLDSGLLRNDGPYRHKLSDCWIIYFFVSSIFRVSVCPVKLFYQFNWGDILSFPYFTADH